MHRKPALTDPYAKLAQELKDREKPLRQPLTWLFIVFMVALALLCAGLGYWQLQRLEQKQALIAAVAERASLPPIALPAVSEWEAFDPEVFNFRPVTLTGTFDYENTVFVFTALTEARGEKQGPGFWIMSPFDLEDGGTVIVNRGFVPQSAKDLFGNTSQDGSSPSKLITVGGIARVTEQVGPFTPGPDTPNRVEYVRTIERLAIMMNLEVDSYAPIYVDQGAGEKGLLPQGGETVMSFPNRHLGYAMTWFGLAAVAIFMTLYWLWRQRRV